MTTYGIHASTEKTTTMARVLSPPRDQWYAAAECLWRTASRKPGASRLRNDDAD